MRHGAGRSSDVWRPAKLALTPALRSVLRSFLLLGVLAVALGGGAVLPLQAQDACAVPQGNQGQPLFLPSPQEESLIWSLVLEHFSWQYDRLGRKVMVDARIFNKGAERVRGAGIQVQVFDGLGHVIHESWKLTDTVYLEAGALAEIAMEFDLPQGAEAAGVKVEAVMVMGSCGW